MVTTCLGLMHHLLQFSDCQVWELLSTSYWRGARGLENVQGLIASMWWRTQIAQDRSSRFLWSRWENTPYEVFYYSCKSLKPWERNKKRLQKCSRSRKALVLRSSQRKHTLSLRELRETHEGGPPWGVLLSPDLSTAWAEWVCLVLRGSTSMISLNSPLSSSDDWPLCPSS